MTDEEHELIRELEAALIGLLELTAETSKLRAYGIDTSKLTIANIRAFAALAKKARLIGDDRPTP